MKIEHNRTYMYVRVREFKSKPNKLSSAKIGSDQISLKFWKGDQVDFRVKIKITDLGFTTEHQNNTDKLK